MSIETKPNLKQQVSRERVWHLADAAGKLGIAVHVIANEGENISVSHNKSIPVSKGYVGIDIRAGEQMLDHQILHELRNTADDLHQADKRPHVG